VHDQSHTVQADYWANMQPCPHQQQCLTRTITNYNNKASTVPGCQEQPLHQQPCSLKVKEFHCNANTNDVQAPVWHMLTALNPQQVPAAHSCLAFARVRCASQGPHKAWCRPQNTTYVCAFDH